MKGQLRTLTWVVLAWVLTTVGCASSPSPTPPSTSSSKPAALSAPTVIAVRGDKLWNYVTWGDSTMFSLGPRYAAILEQDLGVKVKLHDWTESNEDSSELLQALRTNESLRQDIREADAITFIIPTHVFSIPLQRFLYGSPTECGGADNQDCVRQALAVYRADADAIIAQVASLRRPSEALVRMRDNYLFMVKDIKAHGKFEVVNKYWREANEHVSLVAAKYHIPVVRSYAAFMGPTGDEDPVDNGYVSDGFHPTDKGTDLIAKLFRELGYAFAPVQ